MALIQPKPYLDRFKVRNKATGKERRRNMSKIILENSAFFPKPITYEDIDKEFFNWVDKKLDLVYDGKRLPTYRLFSNQKISEYSQTWQNLDDTGNIIMNFKTITRDNNPQHGEGQGAPFNVPGHRDYTMFAVPVLQENGEEAYDLYSMKQPFAINFVYTVNLICNKYELLNRFNEMVHYEFQSLECYIAPNGHAMPMILESINDESEYTIDDRKFYSQTFSIKVMGYIIRKEDYKVTRVPSRFIVKFLDSEETKKNKRITDFDLKTNKIVSELECGVPYDTVDIHKKRGSVILKEEELPDNCCIKDEEDKYHNKSLEYEITIPNCESGITFAVESDMVLTEVTTENVYDFTIYTNNEFTDLDFDVSFLKEDEIKINITRDDLYSDSKIIIKGYDPNIIVDITENKESELDATPVNEKIIVDGNDKDID
jgi:hypothetical protein